MQNQILRYLKPCAMQGSILTIGLSDFVVAGLIGMKGINNMEEQEKKVYPIREYILFKLDRQISIVGLVILAGWSLFLGTTESLQLASAIAGGLIVYVTGRGSVKG